MASAISPAKLPVGHKVYLDDVLLDTRHKRILKQGRWAVVRELKRAGFIIGRKSELRPTKKTLFVGKLLNTLRKTITNQPSVLAGAFRMWLRGVGAGKMSAAH